MGIIIFIFTTKSQDSYMDNFGKRRNLILIDIENKIIPPYGPFWYNGKGVRIYKTTYNTTDGHNKIFWFRFGLMVDIYEDINGTYTEVQQ